MDDDFDSPSLGGGQADPRRVGFLLPLSLLIALFLVLPCVAGAAHVRPGLAVAGRGPRGGQRGGGRRRGQGSSRSERTRRNRGENRQVSVGLAGGGGG